MFFKNTWDNFQTIVAQITCARNVLASDTIRAPMGTSRLDVLKQVSYRTTDSHTLIFIVHMIPFISVETK